MAEKLRSPRGDLLRAMVFAPLGFCLLFLTFVLVHNQLDFLAHAQRAEGQVSALNAGGSHPQIDFTDAHGKAFSYPQNGFIWGYEVGDRVTVLYRPENPDVSAIIEANGVLWVWSLVAGLLGILFAAGGIYHLMAWIRHRRQA